MFLAMIFLDYGGNIKSYIQKEKNQENTSCSLTMPH